MFVLTAKITINSDKNWTFDKVQKVVVVRNCESLTDTCSITLPRKVKWKDEVGTPVKGGDKVLVELGYNNELQTAFRGYITKISAKGSLVIDCEDEMSRIKGNPALPSVHKTNTLSQLLEDQQLGVPFKVFGEQNLGAYRVKVDTVGKLFGKLQELGFQLFFRDDASGKPTLYGGVLFDKQGERVQVFDTARNLIDKTLLKFTRADEYKIKFEARSVSPKNEVVEAEAGESKENIRKIYAYNKTKPELQAWVDQELKKYKCDGLTGSFTTFGAKLVDKLDTIGIILDGEKCGEYQVLKNTITYDTSGFRQKVEIGKRTDKQ